MAETDGIKLDKQSHYDCIPYLTMMISEFMRPVKILLFGSCARGCVSRHSDIDLCIVVREELDSKERIRIRQLMLERIMEITDQEVDLLIIDEKAWEKNYTDLGTLTGKIAREGVLLYGG